MFRQITEFRFFEKIIFLFWGLPKRNSFIFEGSRNILSLNTTWTCKFLCNFDYTCYPFDTQNCFDIFGERNQLWSNRIEYVGDYILGKYTFWKLNDCEVDKNKRRAPEHNSCQFEIGLLANCSYC